MKYDITDFGARRGEDAPQTGAIQAAIDACFLAGGGEVVVPEGTFLTGGIRLRTGVTLHLLKNARLLGTRNPADYFGYLQDEIEPMPPEALTDCRWTPASAGPENHRDTRFITVCGSPWNNALIRAYRARNIAILGEENSRLDGANCFDPRGEEHYRGPHMIDLWECENVRLAGYTVVDSANWAHAIFSSRNIHVENVTCIAGHDGVHVQTCDNVRVVGCDFRTGDDCVAGFDNANVLVDSCRMNTACSALRFGGTNVLVQRCRIWGPAEQVFRGSLTDAEKESGAPARKEPGHRYNMLSVLTYYADFTAKIRFQPGNIVIRDCEIENVDRFLHYNFSGNEPWQKGRPLSDAAFESIRARGIRLPLTAYGETDAPFTLCIRDAEIAFAPDAQPDCFLRAHACRRIELEKVKISGLENAPLIKSWGEVDEVICQNLECAVPETMRLVPAREPFVCTAI